MEADGSGVEGEWEATWRRGHKGTVMAEEIGEERGERRERAEEISTLPENTLGILDRKLFTVRIGMPFLSSCIRAIKSSIWLI